MFQYLAHGLTIASPLECAELWPGENGTAGVNVRYGETPDSLLDAVATGVRYQAPPGRFLL